jgi:hypothetical protein
MIPRKAKTNAAAVRSKAARAVRARSTRNALRHGLNIPVSKVSDLAPQIEHLAEEIAGADAPTEVRDYARAVADAHIDVCRVRRTRQLFLERALNEHYETCELAEQKFRILKKWLSPKTAFAPVPRSLVNLLALPSIRNDPEKWGRVVITHTETLSAFDRYERRALSRRARAIERFDGARALADHLTR